MHRGSDATLLPILTAPTPGANHHGLFGNPATPQTQSHTDLPESSTSIAHTETSTHPHTHTAQSQPQAVIVAADSD
jgi:hypothetical protein